MPKVNAPAAGTFGKTLYFDKFGEWRSVPGFEKEQLNVSSEGFVRLGRKDVRANQAETGYRSIMLKRCFYKVATLVTWAFHGGPPSLQHTVDHIAKNDDFMIERGNDSASNLRWATRKEQIENRVVKPNNARCKPLFARHISWSDYAPSRRFEHAKQAAIEMGWTHLRVQCCVRFGTKDSGWTFKYIDVEDQCDIYTPENDLELWKEINEVTSVSSYGRVQIRHLNRWQPRRTPMPTKGCPYATVRVSKKLHYVHRLVWQSFGTHELSGAETVQHINNVKHDNRICNLRADSKRGKTLNQRPKKRSRTQYNPEE